MGDMPYTIAVAGKGGVGKTTVTYLLIQLLLKIDKPILAVDADPNSNLNMLFGAEYPNTIADIREDAKNLSSQNMSRSEFFNLKLEQAITEMNGVDLIVMGRPEGSGCYCAVNNVLRDYLLKLGKDYKFIVIDNEAGMEHLSRRTASNIDELLLVSDPTLVGIQAAINAYVTTKKANLKVKGISLIINKATKELDKDKIRLLSNTGIKIDGYIPYQEKISTTSEEGNVMPSSDSGDLCKIVDKILGKARVL